LEAHNVKVILSNTNGSTVHENNYQISAVQPASIDMSAMAAGAYTVTMKFDSKTITENIVKL
jgi:hypothetical protein